MEVQEMWLECSHRKVSEVAKKHGLTTQHLVALFDQAGLTGRRAGDPGPDELAAAVRRIRRSWTPEQRRSRWIAAREYSGWA